MLKLIGLTVFATVEHGQLGRAQEPVQLEQHEQQLLLVRGADAEKFVFGN